MLKGRFFPLKTQPPAQHNTKALLAVAAFSLVLSIVAFACAVYMPSLFEVFKVHEKVPEKIIRAEIIEPDADFFRHEDFK